MAARFPIGLLVPLSLSAISHHLSDAMVDRVRCLFGPVSPCVSPDVRNWD